MSKPIPSAASLLLQQQIDNTPKTPLGRVTTVARAANIPQVGLNAPVIGRPKGEAAKIKEFKEQLINTKGGLIVERLMTIALNDSHNGQMAALKMCIDRILPLSLFDKSSGGGGGNTPQVSINIQGFGAAPTPTITAFQDIEG